MLSGDENHTYRPDASPKEYTGAEPSGSGKLDGKPDGSDAVPTSPPAVGSVSGLSPAGGAVASSVAGGAPVVGASSFVQAAPSSASTAKAKTAVRGAAGIRASWVGGGPEAPPPPPGGDPFP